MAKKRGRPPKDQSKTAVESASATSNPSTASTLVDKEKMAQIIFEARYLIGKNVDRASRSKTHLCNKHNISIPTYYVWEKSLSDRTQPMILSLKECIRKSCTNFSPRKTILGLSSQGRSIPISVT